MKEKPPWLLEALFIAGAALSCFVLFYHRWPIWEDQGTFHYIAWGITHGLIPYVDIIEWNWPGMFGVHVLARWISGANPLGLRLVDSLYVMAACLALACILASLRTPRPLRLLCITAYVMSYFFNGYNNTAQRESFALPPLLLGCVPWVWAATADKRGPLGWFFGAGLIMAAGVWAKPTVAPLGLVIVAWAFLPAWRAGLAWRRLLTFVSGGLLGCVLYVIWLYRLGSLR
jgi:hypothetical protein